MVQSLQPVSTDHVSLQMMKDITVNGLQSFHVPQAMGEYIKAWFILHVIAKEFDLGAQDGFQFNISVGYDLAGIKELKG